LFGQVTPRRRKGRRASGKNGGGFDARRKYGGSARSYCADKVTCQKKGFFIKRLSYAGKGLISMRNTGPWEKGKFYHGLYLQGIKESDE